MALFKAPDNIVRKIDFVNTITSPSQNYFKIDVPLKYGETYTPATKLYQQSYGLYSGSVTWYAISASYPNGSSDWASNTDFIERVTFDNSTTTWRTVIAVQRPYNINKTLAFDTTGRNWGHGRGQYYGQALMATTDNDRFYGDQNYYLLFLKAGDDIRYSSMYEAFGPNGFIEKGVIDYVDNSNIDCLVVLKRKPGGTSTVPKELDNAQVRPKYYRAPVIPDGAGSYTRVAPKLGHAIYEFLTNNNWGLNIDENRLVRADWIDTGNIGGGTFNLYDKPLTDFLDSLSVEFGGKKIIEQQGKIRLVDFNNTGIALTDDNVLGEIEIQYPDLSLAPTQVIAQYNSKEQGLVNLVYGSDTTNTQTIFLQTATTLAQAESLMSDIWEEWNLVTIKFKGDRSCHQFSLNDRLTLATSKFSGTITIVEMQVNSDYTVDITAEATTNAVVPDYSIGTARPLLNVDGGFYRPRINERDFDPDNPIIVPPTPPVPTPPDVIEPPARILRTFSGLNHPYNFYTGSENLDWYLGSTVDGLTVDDNYDSNGCRTQFKNFNNAYALYANDFSLIFRPVNEELPVAIKVGYDIGLSTGEKNGNIVGTASYRNIFRVHFPGFYSSENNTFRYKSTRLNDWTVGNKNWAESYPYRSIPGGTKDVYYEDANTNEFVFQVGENTTAQLVRAVSTFDANNSEYTINLPSSFGGQFADLAMRKTSGGDNLYRLHFAAIYGDINSPTRVEYIGTTTTWGDGRSILPADQSEARETARAFGINWAYTYVSPPSRSVS